MITRASVTLKTALNSKFKLLRKTELEVLEVFKTMI